MKTQDKIEFSYNVTTKEQFLKFKNYMKESAAKGPGYISHYETVAYYMFKHRIGADPENEYLVDTAKLEEYLDEAVKNCYKCLYNGEYTYSCGTGGYWTERCAIPGFKNKVRETYNKFANLPKEDGDKEELHLAALF